MLKPDKHDPFDIDNWEIKFGDYWYSSDFLRTVAQLIDDNNELAKRYGT